MAKQPEIPRFLTNALLHFQMISLILGILLLIGFVVWLFGWITQGPWVWLFLLTWGGISLREWLRRSCPLHGMPFEYEYIPDWRPEPRRRDEGIFCYRPILPSREWRRLRKEYQAERQKDFPYVRRRFRSFANPDGKYELRYCPICRLAERETNRAFEKRWEGLSKYEESRGIFTPSFTELIRPDDNNL
jgi:hypothetical protein